MENLSFLGFRSYSFIPDYVRRFSAAIIPFQRNLLTEAVNAVKLYEYCAASIPVIATYYSDDLRSFQEYISIGRSHEEFLAHLRSALAQPISAQLRTKMQDFARENDWSAKALAILSALHNLRTKD